MCPVRKRISKGLLQKGICEGLTLYACTDKCIMPERFIVWALCVWAASQRRVQVRRFHVEHVKLKVMNKGMCSPLRDEAYFHLMCYDNRGRFNARLAKSVCVKYPELSVYLPEN